jgi:hypothetical protein
VFRAGIVVLPPCHSILSYLSPGTPGGRATMHKTLQAFFDFSPVPQKRSLYGFDPV